ncbi:dTMP kinase [Reinekea sp.]|jgi:dTMP kinase|uniref:dTMP kinase n=1 Tax=Reinekea sp. TaxID=1970455 RepID=UPI002A8285E8|nr:dTMP kinase [Reinekea sp.]
MTGMFISIEGLEGAGKTTQAEVLLTWLRARGHDIIRTREPGGTEIAEAIRALILSHHDEQMDPVTELLLVFAARQQHVTRLIQPALASGQWVISDRFTDATYAYQGGGRGLDRTLIASLETTVLANFQPDLTIWFDCDAATGLARAQARGALDRIEGEDIAFFNRCRAQYQLRCEQHPQRFLKIDAAPPQAQVSAQLIAALEVYFA